MNIGISFSNPFRSVQITPLKIKSEKRPYTVFTAKICWPTAFENGGNNSEKIIPP